MDSPKSPPSIIKPPWRWRQVLAYLCLASGLTLLFYYFNLVLLDMGYASDFSLWFGHKCKLALEGLPPRLENVGGVYPPLPYMLVLVFRDPLLAASVAGGLTGSAFVMYLVSLLKNGSIGHILFIFLIPFILLSPTMLFVLTQRSDLAMTLLFFMTSLFLLRWFHRDGFTVQMVLFGIFFGLLFMNEIGTVLVAVLMLPFFMQIGRRHNKPSLPMMVVAFFPVLFFLLSEMYMSRIFFARPFPFVELRQWLAESSRDVRELFMIRGDLSASLNYIWRQAGLLAPVALPWLFVGGIRLFEPVPFREKAWRFFIFVSPAILTLSMLYFGSLTTLEAAVPLFLAVALLFLSRAYGPVMVRRTGFSVLLLVCLLVSFAADFKAAQRSDDPSFRRFAGILTGRGPSDKFGKDAEMAGIMGPPGRILMDDATGHQLVYLHPDPKRFILPYQYEFETALSRPEQFARFVLVSRIRTEDLVAKRYPDTLRGRLEGFRVLKSTDEWILFERVLAISG